MDQVSIEDVPKKVKDFFNKGFAAMERSNLDYAIDMFSECIEMEPRFFQARRYLRIASLRKQKGKKGGGLMSSLKSKPAILAARSKLKGDPRKAMSGAEKVLRDDPLNIEANKLLCEACAAADMPEIGIQSLELLRENAEQESTDILILLSDTYKSIGRSREAREALEKVIELNPGDLELMKKLKDLSAIESMDEGGWQEADDGGDWKDIIKDREEAAALELAGKAFKTEDDALRIIKDTLAQIEAEPANMNFRRKLARAYEDAGQEENAIAALEEALEMSGGDPGIENALSTLRLKHFDSQIKAYKEAGDEESAAAIEEQKEDYKYQDLQERVVRYPNELQLRYELGLMSFNRGMVDEAIKQFQKARSHPQHAVTAMYYLALCFRHKGIYDMAKDQLESAAEQILVMDDNKKAIIYLLGEVC